MTTADKKQRNREYYLKNRERILTKAKARNSRKHATHLEIVPALEDRANLHPVQAVRISGKTSNFQTVQAPTSERISEPTDVAESAQRVKLAGIEPNEREVSCELEQKTENGTVNMLGDFFSRIPLSFVLRMLLVAGLTILMTAMQVAFYREHDILPGYAISLALAGEMAFLSLVTMKLRAGLDWIRIAIHLIFFGFFVSAISFHVYAKSRTKAASQLTVTMTEATEIMGQLKQAERSLEVATKGRAWKNMEIFGAEVSRLRNLIRELPTGQVLGTSSAQVLWMEAILLILARGLLLGASALNTVRLREQFCEMGYCNEPVSPSG